MGEESSTEPLWRQPAGAQAPPVSLSLCLSSAVLEIKGDINSSLTHAQMKKAIPGWAFTKNHRFVRTQAGDYFQRFTVRTEIMTETI